MVVNADATKVVILKLKIEALGLCNDLEDLDGGGGHLGALPPFQSWARQDGTENRRGHA